MTLHHPHCSQTILRVIKHLLTRTPQSHTRSVSFPASLAPFTLLLFFSCHFRSHRLFVVFHATFVNFQLHFELLWLCVEINVCHTQDKYILDTTRCLFAFVCVLWSILLSFPSMSFPSFSPSFPLSPAPLVSMCLCGSQQTCQPVSIFRRQGLVLFLLSLLSFPVVFSPLLLCEVRQGHSIPHIRTRKQASTNSFSHTPSQVHPPAVSLSHTLITTHTLDALCQKHTPTQGLVFKCSNEDEWAQNEECVSN